MTAPATVSGVTLSSTASVTVSTTAPIFTSVTVAPNSASVNEGGSQLFTATALDRTGTPLATQPVFTWTVTGVGTVSSAGLYAVGAVAGSATVTASATVNGITLGGSAGVTVIPTVAIGIHFAEEANDANDTAHVYNVTGVAGVVPMGNWNNVADYSTTNGTVTSCRIAVGANTTWAANPVLTDNSGNATTAVLTSFQLTDVWDAYGSSQTNQNSQLMNSYLDNTASGSTKQTVIDRNDDVLLAGRVPVLGDWIDEFCDHIDGCGRERIGLRACADGPHNRAGGMNRSVQPH